MVHNLKNAQKEQCRLCGHKCLPVFAAIIINKYNIEYYRCENCHSLQSEMPYWIDEAYGSNLAALDTGAAQRNLINFYICRLLCGIFSLKNVIDIGGGDGFFCRMLRDYRINCYVQDKYAKPTYAQNYLTPNFTSPDLITAFEVIEHLSNPKVDLDLIFHYKPKMLLLSTGIYRNEGPEWWYLCPETGQHIFFYSQKALEMIAREHGFALFIQHCFCIFYEKNTINTLKIYIFSILIRRPFINLYKATHAFISPTGHWKDHIDEKFKGRS